MTILELVNEGKIPPVLDIPDHVKRIVVHDGDFHADDVFCVALLKECYKEDIIVKRVPRNANLEKYGYDTLICDIGMEYDGWYRFDHHQFNTRKMSMKELRAAIGLLWDSYGNGTLYQQTERLIHDIDKHDCCPDKHRSQLCVSIASFNPIWTADDKEKDRCFDMAVIMARQFLRAMIISDTHVMKAYREISEKSNVEEGVMFLDSKAPYTTFISKYEDVCIVARKCGNTYKCKCVNGYTFKPEWTIHPPISGVTLRNWILEAPSKDAVLRIRQLTKKGSY